MKLTLTYRFQFFLVVVFFLLGFFLHPACKKPIEPTIDKKLLNCSVEYLNYSDNPLFNNKEVTYPPNDLLATKIHFEYLEDILVRIKGGFIPVPQGSDLTNLVFDEELVYDSIVYDGSTVKVFTKPAFAYSAFDKPENPIIYQINTQDRLENITKRDEVKLIYEYNTSQVIEKSMEGEILRTFFMENGNLLSVETKKYVQGILAYKKEILFSEFDNTPNPLKNKFYILGAFYRAFSNNNYRKYMINEYSMVDGEFIQTSSFSFTMPFAYTSAGIPVYGDYEN